MFELILKNKYTKQDQIGICPIEGVSKKSVVLCSPKTKIYLEKKDGQAKILQKTKKK